MNQNIKKSINEALEAISQLKTPEALAFIEKTAQAIVECFKNGGKIIIAGNGGSLCDAAHFAEELTGQFRQKRMALPAIALNDPGHITCVGNDHGFDEIFARGVEAFGKAGDIFIGLTTSGKSPNIIRAFEQAKKQQLTTIAFLGKDGGPLRGKADLELIISGFSYSDRIQEAHMTAIHIIIETIETILFTNTLENMVVCSKTGNYSTKTS